MIAVPLFLLCALGTTAQTDPTLLLTRVKQATGGAAWDRITTTHGRLTLATGGLKGPMESWEATHSGRYVRRFQLGPMSGVNGFDGTSVWSQDTAQQVRIEATAEAREEAANEAYRAALAYFFPERWPARMEYVGEQSEGTRRFDVVRAIPQGGRPFAIWIDAATSLIDRTVEQASLETRTTYFMDYREVQGVRVPFASRITDGDESYDQHLAVEVLEFNVPLEDARFAPPAPPPPDYSIAEGTSTTVPFELLNNHIYLDVRLNGKGPFRVLCDTGGVNLVTPELVSELGLEAAGALQGRGVGEASQDVGMVTLDTLQIGGATLQRQLFYVFALAPLAKVSGVPIHGLVGYEVFRRFVVTLDYERSRLTLTIPSAFAYKGPGTIVPFQFNEHVPQVDGEIDGVPGKLDIDTGSRSSLDLLGPFVEKNGLRAKYAPKVQGVTGWGVGGPARSEVTRAKVLKLGDVTILNPVTELSLQKKGAFSDPYVAGNVGAGVLKRFNVVFDYPAQRLILEPNANNAKPDVFDRTGLWINRSEGGFEVVDVFGGGPAEEAGVRVGDVIVHVDQVPSSRLSLPVLRLRFRSDPPGTRIRLKVRSGAVEREVILTLRDLV